MRIDMHKMRGEKQFWEMLDANIEMVSKFYTDQIATFIKQFQSLTVQCIRLVRIQEAITEFRA